MKIQKFANFVKKNLKVNMLKIKTHKVSEHSHYEGEYRGAAHDICNLS